jgi:hypothetical protein
MALTRSLIICLFGGLSTTAFAQDDDSWRDWPMGSRFEIGVGAFVPNLDTRTQVDSSNGITGTRIDFEQNLGMSDQEALPTFLVEWRFARRHQIGLGHFELNRNGSEITETTIRIGDTVFSADLPVSSIFDVKTFGLSYQYSLIFDPKKELSIGIGLAVQDIRLGIKGNEDGSELEEESDLTAPLPTIALAGGYAFTDKLTFRANVGYLAVEVDLGQQDNLDGTTFEASAFLHHQTFENVRFGLGYSVFDLDMSWTDKGKYTAVQYNYHGPHLIVTATF